MKKVINIIMLTLIGAGCFSAGLYYATKEFDESLSLVMEEYEEISDKVDAFVRVSDPKTIRLYVNYLTKILDDIDFLHTLIETGQLADEALSDMLNNQGSVGNKLDSLYLELSLMIDSINEYNIAQDVVDERNFNSIKSLLSENVDKNKQYIEDLNNQIVQLQMRVNETIEVVDKIKNSKLSKYLK